ncbi:hypothetical protein F52700_10398 [Fusarium sp. NRRL 52700]|nr:hypothetical protein F52700_10398 [Fusarium sp. NRRL 52700]
MLMSPTVLTANVGLEHRLAQIIAGCIQLKFPIGFLLLTLSLDKTSCRSTMMWGSAELSFSMMMVAAILSQADDTSRGRAFAAGSVAFFFTYMLVFGASMNCVPWVYVPEILPLHARTKGTAIGVSSNWFWNFTVVMIAPILINRLQWKAYLIFMATKLIFVPIIFFLYPETSNLDLQEVDYIFDRGEKANQMAREMQKELTLHGRLADNRYPKKALHSSIYLPTMFAKAVLLIAFVCNVSGTPYVVTNPYDLYSTWSSDDFSATPAPDGHSIKWSFTVKGHNGVPDPGNFAASCHGLQVISDDLNLKGKPEFERCNDTAYEARQYFSGQNTTVEVRRTNYPDLGKEVQISATANYSSTNSKVVVKLAAMTTYHIRDVDNRVEGRLALVTGASGGIGSAIARGLAAEGCDVVLHCNASLHKVEALSKELTSAHPGQLFPCVSADLSSRDETRGLVDKVFQDSSVSAKHKAVSILVANAGLGRRIRDIQNIEEDDWDSVMEVNARSQFVVVKACLPAMRAQSWGRVILVGSIASTGGGINGCHYAATKGALSSMGKNLSTVLAGEGVTVNTILPAMIGFTDMIPTPKETTWTRKTDLEELKETDPGLAIAASVPVRRLGHPQEVSNIAVMLSAYESVGLGATKTKKNIQHRGFAGRHRPNY